MEQLHATTVQFIAGVIKCFVVERIVVKDSSQQGQASSGQTRTSDSA